MYVVEKPSYTYQQMADAIEYLYDHFKEQPSLEQVAGQVHMSEFHFQRLFTEWAGISPKRFVQFLTADHLKKKLTGLPNLIDAADSAGLSSQSRVYDLFVNMEAVTPQEYKTGGSGIQVKYGIHDTPFGECIIGITGRGVCFLSFLAEGERDSGYLHMLEHWPQASIVEDYTSTYKVVQQIFYNREQGSAPLSVLVKGTNFQVKVWQALLQIPYGSVCSYQSIAGSIGEPLALQAVGSAVGSNHIAYLIPCHRVIRKNLQLGEYRWGSERKKSMLGWEMTRMDQAV